MDTSREQHVGRPSHDRTTERHWQRLGSHRATVPKEVPRGSRHTRGTPRHVSWGSSCCDYHQALLIGGARPGWDWGLSLGPLPPRTACRRHRRISPTARDPRRNNATPLYFRKNSPILMGRTFFGSTACWSHRTLSSGTSAVISCASVNERIHSSSSNCFELLAPFLLQEHELRVEEESAFFRQVACRPLNCQNECQVLETGAPSVRLLRRRRWRPNVPVVRLWSPGALVGRQFDVRERTPVPCCGLALLWHLALHCSFHHPKQPAPPGHTLHWWDEFRCPSSVESGR